MNANLSLQDQADIIICAKKLSQSSNKKCFVGKRISKNAANVMILSGLNVTRFLFITRITSD